jgi:hypothetical protein
MTTLSDYLNDFAEDLLRLAREYADDSGRLGFLQAKHDLIEEYTRLIKERLIG